MNSRIKLRRRYYLRPRCVKPWSVCVSGMYVAGEAKEGSKAWS
jgi:hypothetical protein